MYRKSAIAAGLLLAASTLGLAEAQGQAGGAPSNTAMLTDGTSMDNFQLAGNANWRIAERTISADRGSGFLVTKQSYDDFRFRAEFWVDEDANSGIFIRCQNPGQPSAQSCYEINIFDSNPNRNAATGSIVGVRPVSNFQATALKWNVIEVEAKGPQINVSINGVRTASARDTRHARGRIGLQYNGGVVRWHKVEITPLTADDIAATETPFYVNCEAGFTVQFPGQPQVRDIRYRTPSGIDVPAKQYYIERDGKLFSETVAQFPSGPRGDERVVMEALAELGKKGEVRFRGFGDYDPGMPGGQVNIFQPDGKQTRASVYMADRRLYITESTAPPGDTDALLFEQTITLIDRAGAMMDRVNAINDPGPPYDCR
jgi:Domain of Unknown Function (DUF1080)